MARSDFRYAFMAAIVAVASANLNKAATLSRAEPMLLHIRQSNNGTTAAAEQPSHSVSIPAIVVPIVVAFIVFATWVALVQRRKLRRVPTQTDIERALRDTPTFSQRCLSFLQRGRGFLSSSRSVQENAETVRPATVVPTDPAEVRAERRRIRRERRNRLRRTDSGHSIRSIPEYKVEAGDDELVLYKTSHGNASSAFDDLSRVETNISSRTDLYSLQDRSLDANRAADGMYWRTGARPISVAVAQISPGLSADEVSASRVSLLPSGGLWTPAAESAPSGSSSVMQATDEEDEGGRGPAPDYSTVDVPSVIVDSVRPSIDTVPDANMVSTPVLPHRPSSWRGMFASTPPRATTSQHRRGASANAIPTMGADSSPSTISTATPPLSRSFSLARNIIGGNRSSSSVNQLAPTRSRPTISAPIADTLVRSNYELPRAGLSELQMTFLGSVENLGRYGISGDGTMPPPFEASVNTPPEAEQEQLASPLSPSLTRPPPLLTRSEAVQRDTDNSLTLRPLPNLETILASREADSSTESADPAVDDTLAADDTTAEVTSTPATTSTD